MRTEQGGGRDEEGAEQGEEMHAALLNSSFSFYPSHSILSAKCSFTLVPLYANSFALHYQAVSFSKKCLRLFR